MSYFAGQYRYGQAAANVVRWSGEHAECFRSFSYYNHLLASVLQIDSHRLYNAWASGAAPVVTYMSERLYAASLASPQS